MKIVSNLSEQQTSSVAQASGTWTETKATNDFCDRKMCFYLINVYPNLAVQHYLGDYGLKIDEDMYALSEMLQFIWRGNIRTEGGEMTVYIASPRMKKLLQDWIGIH